MIQHSRRQMITRCGSGLAAVTALSQTVESAFHAAPHIATNTYPWLTFARRAGQEFQLHSDGLLADIAETGINGYEPIIDSATEFDGLRERLIAHGLQMHSLYVNSVLHDAAQVDASMENVLNIGRRSRELGTKIIVTNPSPIRWSGPEDKSDEQLRLQAKSLDSLGAELRKIGITLAYHNHDAELRQGGREFHHMLTATDPENVRFCLDAHWVYRGCGNSEVAVFDALTHYRDRIVELHLRQSVNGIWTESFMMQGDINYEPLFSNLAAAGQQPHLVLEQAIEKRSPKKLTVEEAHRRGCRNVADYLS